MSAANTNIVEYVIDNNPTRLTPDQVAVEPSRLLGLFLAVTTSLGLWLVLIKLGLEAYAILLAMFQSG